MIDAFTFFNHHMTKWNVMLVLLIHGYLYQLIQLITLLNTFYNLSIQMMRVCNAGASPNSCEHAAAGAPAGGVRGPLS